MVGDGDGGTGSETSLWERPGLPGMVVSGSLAVLSFALSFIASDGSDAASFLRILSVWSAVGFGVESHWFIIGVSRDRRA
jgi:hypothetical protein